LRGRIPLGCAVPGWPALASATVQAVQAVCGAYRNLLVFHGMQVLVPLWGRCAGVKMAVRGASVRAGCRAVVWVVWLRGGLGAGRVLVAAR